MVWALLLVNALGYSAVDLVIPFPRSVAQVVTMGSLAVAFGLALVLNPRVRVRPNPYLLLLSLLALISVVSSLPLQAGLGSFLRCSRLVMFVATLWLISCWWRGDLRFARYHLRHVSVVLLSVLLGVIIAPGSAFSGPGDRLIGVLWPITAPQVGLYCAVATGLAVLLWLSHRIDGRSAAVIAVPAFGLLLLSHTRTALLALVVALLLACLSLVSSTARVRRFLATAVGVVSSAALVFASAIRTFILRGQDAEQLSSLTGRAKVWDLLLAKERTMREHLSSASV